jgi:DNA modification methylase
MIKLLHGDCLELMKDIPDKSIDMILCDLPYGTTACKWDVVIPFEPLWKEYKRIIKDRGCIALFGSEPFSSHLRMSNIKDYKYDWVWEKDKGTGFAFSNKQPLRKTENISVFYTNTPFYDSQGVKLDKPYTHTLPVVTSDSSKGASAHNLEETGVRKYATYTHAKKTNLIYFARDSQKGSLHPTQKPIALLEYLIKTYTIENETVLDNCMGSGSTGVACINTNRNFIGIEKDDKYFEIAKNRIEKAQQDVAPKV